MQIDPTLAPLLFLDFDGVLHPNGAVHPSLFVRTSALMPVLDEHPELEVVISSSWRFHHGWEELLDVLPRRLAERVTACCGAPRPGKLQRYREIAEYISANAGFRPWRSIDDAVWEFPTPCKELIACDGAMGLQGEQLDVLREWLARLRSCRQAVSMGRQSNRPDLFEAACHLLAGADVPSVALLQRVFRISHSEALALLRNFLVSARDRPVTGIRHHPD